MPASYVTHRMKRAKINFTMFLTIFEYAESNAELVQLGLYMQGLELYDLKFALIITQQEH